jgi:NitT/TauT family transport system ATP-binding protein
MGEVLKVDHLSYTYHCPDQDIDALQDVSFRVFEGEFISILGPEGCGKSTLLSLIAGCIHPTKGLIYINGRDVKPSGHYKSRASILRTLSLDTDILLMDEPFSALQEEARRSAADELQEMLLKEGKTAILVTEDIKEAVSLSDRIIILSGNPGTVKTILKIPYSIKNEIPSAARNIPEFQEYCSMVEKELK